MKKFLSIIIFFVALTAALAETSMFYNEFNELLPGMHVNAKNGLNVYDEPCLSGKKMASLSHADYVLIRELGREETLDGITAPWVKIVLYPENWKKPGKEEFGWVFGGNLTPALPQFTNIPEVISEIQKRGKLYASFFPSSFGKNYVASVYLSQETRWQWTGYVNYFYTLERLYCESNQNKIAVALQDCMIFNKPTEKNPYGTLTAIKEGTRIKIEGITAYGVQSSTLYPIYSASEILSDGSTRYLGEVRGIDITDERCFSRVSDGKGGKMTFAYLRAVENDGGASTEKRLNVLEKRFFDLNVSVPSGYKMLYATFTDSEGEKYNFQELAPDATWILRYPLNMEKPVLILEKKSGKYGTARTSLYTLEYWYSAWNHETRMNYICGYEYTNVGSEESGLGYHFFQETKLATYEFQKINGKVVKNETLDFYQEEYEPYKFHGYSGHDGEPYIAHHLVLKAGMYVNPSYRLKLRTSPSLKGQKIGTLAPGTLLKIIELGEETEIDDEKSKWVKVQLVNDDFFIEGARVPAATTGWLFGAYLN